MEKKLEQSPDLRQAARAVLKLSQGPIGDIAPNLFAPNHRTCESGQGCILADLRAALEAEDERAAAVRTQFAAYGELSYCADTVASHARLDPARQCEPGCDCQYCRLDAALARCRALGVGS